MSAHKFNQTEIDAVYKAIFSRRDMRHFVPGTIPAEQLKRLLVAAHHAPSVGYMQPWRFIRITDTSVRCQLQQLVLEEKDDTAKALGQRSDEFMQLKVEGIADCAEVLVVTLCEQREQFIFGRRTLPEMDLASTACAIQNIWLAARAEGLGMGWVSIFKPEQIQQLLNLPDDSQAIAILCLGHVEQFYDKPMLEQENWAAREDLNSLLMENQWGQGDVDLIQAGIVDKA